MSQEPHKTCFGAMFPSTLYEEAGRVMAGKVFSFELNQVGGAFIVGRRVAANVAEWDNCQACPEFESCYKLSMGKLALEAATAK